MSKCTHPETGEFVSGAPFVGGVTWATGLDSKTGRPIESSDAYAGDRPVIVSPDPGGAHNGFPMAFNPATGLVYLPAKIGTQAVHAPDTKWKYENVCLNGAYLSGSQDVVEGRHAI